MEREEDIKMKHRKKMGKRAICLFLMMAMLFTDTGIVVYATEGLEQEVTAEISDEAITEEISTKETMEDTTSAENQDSAETDSEKEDSVKQTPADETTAGQTQPGEAVSPEEETGTDSNENNEENTEAGTEEKTPVVEDAVTKEDSAKDEVENVFVDKSVSENDVENVEEELVMALTAFEEDVISDGEHKEKRDDVLSTTEYSRAIKSIGTTAVIAENGDLYCCGDNGYGQVGNGSTTNQTTLVKVLEDVADAYPTGYITGAIKSNGDLYLFGRNDGGQMGIGTTSESSSIPIKVMENVSYFDAYFHCLAITNDNDLYCWGTNNCGQVGNGTRSNQAMPIKILSNVKKAVATRLNTYVLTYAGELYVWGNNGYGQIGNGATPTLTDASAQTTPYLVLDEVSDFSVASDGDAIGALKNNGDLYDWGIHACGGSGNYKTKSTPTKILENVKKFDVSNDYNRYAITNNGDLYCWGYNKEGQVGVGYTTTSWVLEPQKILSNIRYANANIYSMFAISDENELYSWGENDYGQLGDGTKNNILTPKKVMGNVKEIVGKSRRVIARTLDDEIYTWGSGSDGSIGNGKTEASSSPVKVLDSIAYFMGDNSRFVVTHEGTLYGWGDNYYGQLGTGSTDNQAVPYKMMEKIKGSVSESETKGMCGDNVTWELSGEETNRTLHISGSGEMYDFEAGTAPWSYIANKIQQIIIDEGVTVIGKNSFDGCSNFLNLSLAASIIEIGDGAFKDCESLDNVKYAGTKWGEITIGSDNEFLISAYSAYLLSVKATTLKFVSKYGSGEVNVPVQWGFNILKEDARNFNLRLAKVGVVLAENAYHENLIFDTMLKLGLAADGYDHAGGESDAIARPLTYLGYKKIDMNGLDYNVFTVAVRGTASKEDIKTDVADGAHSFEQSAKNTMTSLKFFMQKVTGKTPSELKAENNIFFLTGHSLGGATANRMATLLGDYASPESILYILTNHRILVGRMK